MALVRNGRRIATAAAARSETGSIVPPFRTPRNGGTYQALNVVSDREP
jgi:hypothetical protein